MDPRRALPATLLLLPILLLLPALASHAVAAEGRPLFEIDLEDAVGDVVTSQNQSVHYPMVDIVSFTSREENGTIVQTVEFAANFTAPTDSIYVASVFRDSSGRNASLLEIMLDGSLPPESRLRATMRDGPRDSLAYVRVEYGVGGNVAKFFIPSFTIPADATCFHPSLHAEHIPSGDGAPYGKDQLAPEANRCVLPDSGAFASPWQPPADAPVPNVHFQQPTPPPGTSDVPGPTLPLLLLAAALPALTRRTR